LERELKKSLTQILKLLHKIEQSDPSRITAIRKRLEEQIEKLKVNPDRSRLEQEMIYYIEKSDITEEKVRLRSHCDYFLDTIKENTSQKGKKLGFIAQEMGREINTIGSKANDAGIQQTVVQMKDELEKVKEQLMNVL
jgi:Uncharacterized stress-induced protein